MAEAPPPSDRERFERRARLALGALLGLLVPAVDLAGTAAY